MGRVQNILPSLKNGWAQHKDKEEGGTVTRYIKEGWGGRGGEEGKSGWGTVSPRQQA